MPARAGRPIVEPAHQGGDRHAHRDPLPLLGGIWVLTEYFEEHTWPSRFASAPDVAGTWDPWFFWVAGIWFVILAIHGLKVYFGSPAALVARYVRRTPTEQEVDRELERLRHMR
jgi:hypothetical protein